MGSSGMTHRARRRQGLPARLPKDVSVGVVSFALHSASTPPTTDRAAVQKAVDGLRSKGETALYEGVQDAVKGPGTVGERSIILLSDGGEHRREPEGREAREAAQLGGRRRADQRQGAGRGRRLQERGVQRRGAPAVRHRRWRLRGHRRQPRGGRRGVRRRRPHARVAGVVHRPPAPGLTGVKPIEIKGVASGSPFTATAPLDLGDGPHRRVDRRRVGRARPDRASRRDPDDDPAPASSCRWPCWPCSSASSSSWSSPSRRSSGRARKERIATIEAYGLGSRASRGQGREGGPSAISQSLVDMGEQFMSGRESTSRTKDVSTVPTSRGGGRVVRPPRARGPRRRTRRLRPAGGSQPVDRPHLGVVAGLVLRRSCCAPARKGLGPSSSCSLTSSC